MKTKEYYSKVQSFLAGSVSKNVIKLDAGKKNMFKLSIS